MTAAHDPVEIGKVKWVERHPFRSKMSIRALVASPLPPDQALNAAAAFWTGLRSWSLVRQTGQTATFSYKSKINWGVFVILLLLMILPALVYAVMAGTSQATMTISVVSSDATGTILGLSGGPHAHVVRHTKALAKHLKRTRW